MLRRFEGIGKDSIKANNMYAILVCVYKNTAISRRDIAKSVNLTPSTVTLLVSEMISVGILYEGEEIVESGRAGRRTILIQINRDFGYLVGVCVEPNRLSFAISFLGGEVIDKFVVPHNKKNSELIDTLLELTEKLIFAQHNLHGRFCAIGISISGQVDPGAGISINSYGVLPPHTDLCEIFNKRFNTPVFMDNNVRSLACAEVGTQTNGKNINGLFIKHDPGFGSTLLLGGEVFSGSRNSSGELGHVRVVDNNKLCICGRTGCLSTVVATSELIGDAMSAFSPNTTPELWRLCSGSPHNIELKSLVKSAELGDKPIVKLLEDAVVAMSQVIQAALLTMDGDTIITFGVIFEMDWFFSLFEKTIQELFGSFRRIRVKKSGVADDDRWKGAIFIAFWNYLKTISQEICAN